MKVKINKTLELSLDNEELHIFLDVLREYKGGKDRVDLTANKKYYLVRRIIIHMEESGVKK